MSYKREKKSISFPRCEHCLFAAKFHTIPGKLVILSKKKVFLFNLFGQ